MNETALVLAIGALVSAFAALIGALAFLIRVMFAVHKDFKREILQEKNGAGGSAGPSHG